MSRLDTHDTVHIHTHTPFWRIVVRAMSLVFSHLYLARGSMYSLEIGRVPLKPKKAEGHAAESNQFGTDNQMPSNGHTVTRCTGHFVVDCILEELHR